MTGKEFEKRILDKYGLKVNISRAGYVVGFPNDPKDKYPHYKYVVHVKRSGRGITFPFYGSYHDFQQNIRKVDRLEVLESFLSDATFLEGEGITNWTKMTGYGYDEKGAKRVYNALVRARQKALKLFTENEIYELGNKLREVM